MPFTVSPHDADRAEHNIERVMQALMVMLDKIQFYLGQSEPETINEHLPVVPIPIEEIERSTAQIEAGSTPLELEGHDPKLLTAGPPLQIEGTDPKALPPGRLLELPELKEPAQLEPVQVKIQVGDSTIEGQYGDDLQAAISQLSPERLERLRQALAPEPDDTPAIDVEAVSVEVDGISITPEQIAPEQMEEPPPAPRTDLLSVEEIESRTGNDFSNSPHLGDVAPVVVQVDDQGRILNQTLVQQQVESRVEDAEEMDAEDVQQAMALEEPERAAQTLQQFFDVTGLERFEGERFVLQKQGDLMTITAKDGRGLLFAAQGEQVMLSNLEPQDFAQLEQGRTVMARYAEIQPPAPVAPPPSIVPRGLELELG